MGHLSDYDIQWGGFKLKRDRVNYSILTQDGEMQTKREGEEEGEGEGERVRARDKLGIQNSEDAKKWNGK